MGASGYASATDYSWKLLCQGQEIGYWRNITIGKIRWKIEGFSNQLIMEQYASVVQWILGTVATVGGSYAVVRAQVADLRSASRTHGKEIDDLKISHAVLEERNSGFGKKLDGALDKLEHVTGQLQSIAIEMARNSTK
jgi:hypothetical protein